MDFFALDEIKSSNLYRIVNLSILLLFKDALTTSETIYHLVKPENNSWRCRDSNTIPTKYTVKKMV
jgi:hypothetical protein